METVKKVSHTPGPWVFGEEPNGVDSVVIEHEGFPLCTVRALDDCSCYEDDEEKDTIEMFKANAKLIAAAPDLLKALYGLSEYFKFMIEDPQFHKYTEAISAIKKATE